VVIHINTKPAGRLDNKKELLDGNTDKLDRTA
jgi:hypothetical protein